MADEKDLVEMKRGTAVFPWPVRFLGPAPGLKELNLICWGLYAGLVVVPLVVKFWIQLRSGAGMAKLLPLDFIYFYGIGRIANEYPLVRLYDYDLQLKVFNEIYPLREGFYGPSPYPPFVALFFSLFARVPFGNAYLLWMVCSLTLYLLGIAAAIKAAFPWNRLQVSLIFCFALAFYPFAISNFTNGQLASVAVFSFGLTILLERRSSLFLSGLALSILAYKPTLLLLIFPMLLITRRFRQLSGFVVGVAALALISTAFGGMQIWPAYQHFLSYFSQAAGLNGQSVLVRWKYVDLASFSYAVPGGRSAAGLAILACISCAIALWIAVLLWRSARAGWPAQSLAWAAVLIWTLLTNVYVPIYDSVLVILGLILTVGALNDLEWRRAEGRMILLAALTFAVSWVTVPLAKSHGIQLLTVLIFALGLEQLLILQRAIRLGQQETEHELAAN